MVSFAEFQEDILAFEMAVKNPSDYYDTYGYQTTDPIVLERGDLDGISGIDSQDAQMFWQVHGYGYGELNGNRPVDGLDFGILLGNWNPTPPGVDYVQSSALQGDLNFDNYIEGLDVGIINGVYPTVTAPSQELSIRIYAPSAHTSALPEVSYASKEHADLTKRPALITNNYVVNTTGDGSDSNTASGDGFVDADSLTDGHQVTLRGALEDIEHRVNNGQASEEFIITFHPDIHDQVINISSQLEISGNVRIQAIDGSNITIQSDGTDRVFEVNSGADVTLENLTITGGAAADGAGIYNSGVLTLESVVIKGNHATQHGGGIYNNTGELTLSGVTVGGSTTADKNEADNSGGGIFSNKGNVSLLSGTVIEGNLADNQGGGIKFQSTLGHTLEVANSSFIDNSAGSGGGIYIINQDAANPDQVELNISGNSSVVGNEATTTVGGGIAINNDGKPLDKLQVNLDGITIAGNSAASHGGGVSVSDATIFLNNASIGGQTTGEANTALSGNGGGIYNDGASLSIVGGLIKNNQAYQAGAIQANSAVALTDVSVENNSASYVAGAIYSTGAILTINGGSFSSNTSDNNAGAIYAQDGTLNISESANGGTVFTSNSSTSNHGGAIFGNDAEINIDGATFGGTNAADANKALAGNGGAIAVQSGTGEVITITNTIIQGNESSNGGGIYAVELVGASSPMELKILSGTIISDNSASRGGGVYVGKYTEGDSILATIKYATISNNTATIQGGGIYKYLGSAEIVNSVISNNVSRTGGGLYYRLADGDHLHVIDSWIVGNTVEHATESTVGGGAYIEGIPTSPLTQAGEVIITGTFINSNKSTDLESASTDTNHSGGLYLLNVEDAQLVNSTVKENEADDFGGGVSTYNSDVSIRESTLSDNKSNSNGGGIYSYAGTAEIVDTYIYGNEAAAGGGIYSSDQNLTIDHTDIFQNKSASDGGGITIYGKGNGKTRSISNSRVANNESLFRGGGVWVRNNSISNNTSFDITISNTSILNNKAVVGLGGGLVLHHSNSWLDGNEDTVRVENSNVNANLENTTIADNRSGETGSDRSGGGIYSLRGDLSLVNSTIRNNLALEASGGGIYKQDGNLTVTTSEILGNSAKYGGGIFGRYTDSVHITKSSIVSNIATSSLGNSRGAGVDLSGSSLSPKNLDVIIRDTTVAYNQSVPSLGSTHNHNTAGLNIAYTDTAEIINSTISNNFAHGQYGGIRFFDTTNATITNSTVAYNESRDGLTGTSNPGAVHNAGGLTQVTAHNSIFAENKASGLTKNFTSNLASGSSNNLFSATGSSGGLTDDVNGNIVLEADEPLGLAPLSDNGATVLPSGNVIQTHALLPGSLAIDNGDYSNITGLGIVTDQRGFTRFVNSVDIGAFELSQAEYLDSLGEAVVGPNSADFNGDSRPDQLFYDSATSSLNVVLDTDDVPITEHWGTLDNSGTWVRFEVGDFNGDGRDDVWAWDSGSDKKWRLALSDGSTFIVPDVDALQFEWIATIRDVEWVVQYVGDFDADGSDELLGWSGTNWQVIQFDQINGVSIPVWGSTLVSDGVDPATVLIADANLDGRDDLVIQDTAQQIASHTNDWVVALSVENGVTSGTFAAPTDWDNWFDGHLTGGVLDAESRYQEALDIFSNIYNNYELELYPGLMKGPQATRDTQAGNPWDLAATLVDDLTHANIDASIVTKQVTVPVAELNNWLGLGNVSAEQVRNILRIVMDSSASSSGNSVSFTHAWVQAELPTDNGLETVTLDPSWKFHEQLDGIYVDLADGDGRGTFDEYEYLTLPSIGTEEDPEETPILDSQLPVEFYEDQVQQYLTEMNPGSSLADVGVKGPIITKVFHAVEDIELAKGEFTYPGNATNLGNFNALKDNDQYAHQLLVKVSNNNGGSNNSYNIDIPNSPSYSSYTPFDASGASTPDINFTSLSNFSDYSGFVDTSPIIETNVITVPISGTSLVSYGDDASALSDTTTSISLSGIGEEQLDSYAGADPGDIVVSHPVSLVENFTDDSTHADWTITTQDELGGYEIFDGNSAQGYDYLLKEGYGESPVSINSSHPLTEDTVLTFDLKVTPSDDPSYAYPHYAPFTEHYIVVGGKTLVFEAPSFDSPLSSNPNVTLISSSYAAPPKASGYVTYTIPLADFGSNFFDTTAGSMLVGQVWRNTYAFSTIGAGSSYNYAGPEAAAWRNVTLTTPANSVTNLGNKILVDGTGYKTLDVSDYEITPYTKLEFKFNDSFNPLGYDSGNHSIGWDNDSNYEPYDDQARLYDLSNFYTAQSGEQPISIPLADYTTLAGLNDGASDQEKTPIGKTISQLVFGVESGESIFSDIKLVEEYPPGEAYIAGSTIRLEGTASRAIDISNYAIEPTSVLKFKFRSNYTYQQGLWHSIGWDSNGSPAANGSDLANVNRVEFGIFGSSFSGSPYYSTYNGTQGGWQEITIPIGNLTSSGIPLSEKSIDYLTFNMIGDDLGTTHFSEYKEIKFEEIEETPVTSSHSFGTANNGTLVLTGTKAVSFDVSPNFEITHDTRLRFDFKSSSEGFRHRIGWDTNSSFNNDDENEFFYDIYGTDVGATSLYDIYSGSGNIEAIEIPIGELTSNGNSPIEKTIDRLIFTVEGYDAGESINHDAKSWFSNVELVTPTATAQYLAQTPEAIRLSGTSFKTIPINSYNVTPNTVLEFEFKSTDQGLDHGIGFDTDNSATNGNSNLFSIYGTNKSFLSPSSSQYSNAPGYQPLSIRLGDQGMSGYVNRLVLFSKSNSYENSNSFFRNIKLYEDVAETGEYISETISVPEHSQDPIHIEFTQNSGKYRPYLYLGAGATSVNNYSTQYFGENDDVSIQLVHTGPTALVGTQNNPTPQTYTQKAGEVISIGLDANQHSRETIAELQNTLVDALANNSSIAHYQQDIPKLLSYAAAKYWFDFNTHAEIINDLTHTVGGQSWVGSGVVASKENFLRDPGNSDDSTNFVIDYLPYTIAPEDMAVDLPNITHNPFNRSTGEYDAEAFQLIGYNGSALEHEIVEETITSPSVSTMKGLQRAIKNAFGYGAGEVTISDDRVLRFISYLDGSGVRHIEHVEDWKQDGITLVSQSPTAINAGAVDTYLDSVLPNFTSAGLSTIKTGIRNALLDTQSDKTTVLIPVGRTVYGNWKGGVYLVEKPTSIGLKIVAEDGQVTNGASSIGSLESERILPTFDTTLSFAGDPVNTASGNMFRDDVDFSYPNLGVPLSFARHYDSQNKDDLGLGVGWTYSFGDLLIEDPEDSNNIIWITSRGERHTFESDGSGGFNLPATLHGEFTYLSADSTYYYKDKSGMEYHFQELTGNVSVNDQILIGRLKKQQDNIGNGIQVNYIKPTDDTTSSVRRILNVRDLHTTSRRLDFAYNATNDTINTITKYVDDVLQGTWDYNYDTINAKEHLDEVVHPTDASIPSPLKIEYQYYQSGLSQGLMENITEIHDGTSESTEQSHTYKYFPNGRVFSVTSSTANGEDHVQTLNYNLIRNLTEYTDENGNTEIYIHQNNGLTAKQIRADRTHMEYTWGKEGTATEFLMVSNTDELGAIEKFTYYIDGNPADFFDDPATGISVSSINTFKSRELHSSSSKHFVDSSGTPLTGEIVITTEYDYIQPAERLHMINLASTGTDDITTIFAYDSNGRLEQTTDALGNVTTRTYYADVTAPTDGLLESETSPRGNDTDDSSDRNQEYVRWEKLNSSDFDVTGNTLSVELTAPSDMPSGTHVAADAIRIERVGGDYQDVRVIDSTDGSQGDQFTTAGSAIYLDNSGAGYSTMFDSDYVKLTAPDSKAIWTFTNLEAGSYRIYATWQKGSSRSENAEFIIFNGTPTTYSDTPVQKSVDQTEFPSMDVIPFTTTFNYDDAGNVTQAKTDNIPTSIFTYDHHGNIKTSTAPDGVVTEYTYDILGRQKQVDVIPHDGGENITSTIEYDSNSQLKTATDPLGRVVNSEYDQKGNLVKQIYPDGTFTTFEYDGLDTPNLISQTDPLGRKTEFKYDRRNRLIETIAPDGTIEKIRYNGIGQVVATIDALGRETKFTYDGAGRLLSTQVPQTDTTVNSFSFNHYDSLGRINEIVDFNNNTTEYKYDKLGRVTETTGPSFFNPDKSRNETLTYAAMEYDAAGNVKRTTVVDMASLYENDISVPDLQAFIEDYPEYVQITETRYDALNRPIEAVNPDGTSTQLVYDNAGRVKYTYDELGRKAESTYDGYGRLASTILPDADGQTFTSSDVPITQYEYDAASNQTAIIDPNGNRTEFIYDTFDRVVKTIDAEGNETRSVYDVAGQMVAAIDALGRASYTRYDNRGRVISTSAPDPDGNGPQFGAKTSLVYDEVGNLIEQIDPLGYSTKFEYDELNRLRKESYTEVQIMDDNDKDNDSGYETRYLWITEVDGNSSESFGFDATQVTRDGTAAPIAYWYFEDLPAGDYRVAMTWDAGAWNTDSELRIIPDGGSTIIINNIDQSQAPDDFVRNFQGTNIAWEEFVGSDDFVSISEGQKLTIKLTGSDSSAIRADAVLLERVVSRTFEYDDNGNLVEETDTLGRTTNYTYDKLNRVKTVTLPDPESVDRDGVALPRPETETFYDGYGNVIKTVESRGGQDRTTKFVYDKRNRLETETFAVGTSEEYKNRYVYDSVGNLIQQTMDDGGIDAVTKFQYDNLNRLKQEQVLRSGADTGPNDGLITTYSYDNNGNTLSSTTTLYSSGPTILYQTSTNFTYDGLNRLISTTSDGQTSTTAYDAVGNVIQETDPLGRESTYTYDRQNRLIRTTAPDPDEFISTESSSVTEYEYDIVGNQIAMHVLLAAGGRETQRYTYDNLGRLIRSYDALGSETVRGYDSEGNLLTYTDPIHNKTTYTYDGLNRLSTETITLDDVPYSRSYIYDAQQNLGKTVDRNGREREYTYDTLDRLTEERWLDGSMDEPTLSWEYDNLGRMTRSEDSTTSESYVNTYVYDDAGRMLEQRNFDPANIVLVNNPKVLQKWTYDVFDQEDLPFTGAIFTDYIRTNYEQYSVDSLGTETLIGETTYLTDMLGRTSKVIDSANALTGILDKEIDYTYDLANQMTGVQRTVGTNTTVLDTAYEYDRAGRVTDIEHLLPTDSRPFTSYHYQYDNANRIIDQETRRNNSIAAFAHLKSLDSEGYAFDDAGQLKSVTLSDTASESYDYDKNGNRADSSANGMTSIGEYNRLEADDNYTYLYDEEGNLEKRTSIADGSYTTFAWDYRNRLIRVEQYEASELTQEVEFRYNAAGQLVERVEDPDGVGVTGSASEHYIYNGGERVLEFNDDVLSNRYVHGPLTDQVLFDEVFDDFGQQEELYYLLTDHMQTTRAVLDLAGDVVQAIDYDSFGNVTGLWDEYGNSLLDANNEPDTSQLLTDVTYTGRFWDEGVDLYQYRERWYDASTGRFLSQDPIEEGSNWYLYALNDPINYRDPSGLSAQGHPLNSLSGGYSTGAVQSENRLLNTLGNAAINTASTAVRTFNPISSNVINTGLGLGTTLLSTPVINQEPTVVGRHNFQQPIPQDYQESIYQSFEKNAAIDNALAPYGTIEVLSNGNYRVTGGKGFAPNIDDLAHDALLKEGFQGIPEVARRRRLDNYQSALDAIGMAEGPIGTVADISNGIISATRGNFGTAALSLSSAIPVIGGVIGFLRSAKTADRALDTVDLVSDAGRFEARVGTIDELKAVGATDKHHIIQNATVRDLPGYDPKRAPAIELPGPNKIGTPHNKATTVQRQAGGGNFAAERRIGYKALRKAGVSEADARNIIRGVDEFFEALGVTPSTKTRMPKNRKGGS